MWRVSLFLFGMCLGLLAPSSTAQANVPGFNNMDFLRMQSEAGWRAIEEQQEAAQQARQEAELKKDQQTVAYTIEMANLWSRLATLQNEYYSSKWNEQSIVIGKAMEIKLIKEELLRKIGRASC